MRRAELFLKSIRTKMEAKGLSAVVIPTADPHNSEYVPERFQLRATLTNFKGSAGTAVVTSSEAFLWTDGRYWLEATASLPPGWVLQRSGALGVPTVEEWLEKAALPGPVGIDPYVTDIISWESMAKKFRLLPTNIASLSMAESESEDDTTNKVISAPLHARPIFIRDEACCGESSSSKIQRVCNKIKEAGCDAMILTALDDIAWLTNLRGGDVSFNPVFIAYAIVVEETKDLHLFTLDGPGDTIDPTLVTYAAKHHISLHPYNNVEAFLSQHLSHKVIGVEERQTNYGLYTYITEHVKNATAKRIASIVSAMKGVKNETELKGFVECHKRDGCALVRFMAWLHHEIIEKKSTNLTEFSVTEQLERFRAAEDKFRGLSFYPISASGPNGAIVHYHPIKGKDRKIVPDELYLIDSGGQYEDGTTDVTRVLSFGIPKQEEKIAYTYVLKGHISLGTAVFPEGVAGYRLDCLARQHLWNAGLDYNHGTGHGVGSFLCVHEGPHSIGARLPATSVPLTPGMVASNEPGYYEDGHFGIRIESLVYVVECAAEVQFPTGSVKQSKSNEPPVKRPKSLRFDVLTLAPLCTSLIEPSLLNTEEKAWINNYHSKVRKDLMPFIEHHHDELAKKYLIDETKPI